ncbi:extracellular solute-binding protein [Nocardioides sp. NPDC047086]|uniref:ABC transporter substrate-binding protein n=1 Tax=Nocardioides sp. NPDC047086 TaxID=3154810 RepID=UPI0033DECCD6
MYTGPDRQEMLLAGAKKEKDLLWYTTTIPDQLAEPLAAGFEKKYPFASVEFYRANSTDVASKAMEEYRAGSHDVDVVDGTGTATMLEDAGIIQPFTSPELDAYPAEAKDPDGYWGPQLLYFMAVAYNTDKVDAGEAPRTYEDLLDPRWRGKMSWSTSPTSGGPLFLGNLIEAWGEDRAMPYIDRLAEQKIANVDSSGRSVLDRVVNGQVDLGVQIFNDQVEDAAHDGAPVAWVPLEPVTAQYSRISLLENPPHPHMAMLFLDFMLSKEGQEIIRQGRGIPAHPEVDAVDPKLKPGPGGFEAQFTEPDQVLKQTNEWADLYQEKFM